MPIATPRMSALPTTSVRIGPAAAAESYLSIPALLDAAERSGAGAIHPGYGFLSERAAFASAVADAGLVFVGPSAEVMEQMGRKDRAREIAVAAGVPVDPCRGVGDSATDLDQIAEEVGFPLLAKAAAGGGGKGMRIIRSADDDGRGGRVGAARGASRRSATTRCCSSATSSTAATSRRRSWPTSTATSCTSSSATARCSAGTRRCSEEAPAPTISADVRELVLSSAVELARQVGYVNAGTVEFLVSGDEAYFLEMNTRLQVEHPVTELVTGRDLVQLQLDVAQGARCRSSRPT